MESIAAHERELADDAERGAAHPEGKLQRAALNMQAKKLRASAAAALARLADARTSDNSSFRKPDDAERPAKNGEGNGNG